MDLAQLKQQAAEYAVQFLQSGMVVGLGHGTTARYALGRIAELIREETLTDIRGVPCSLAVQEEASRLGIPLTTLEAHPQIDITIDGADEVTANLDMIKGGGGALLREKIVAQATRRVIIVVDESKVSPMLGTRHTVPVEVMPFGWRSQANFLRSIGALLTVREKPGGGPFLTDNGNMVMDCDFGPLGNPGGLAARLQARAGLVANGLFLGIASEIVVAAEDGIRVLKRE